MTATLKQKLLDDLKQAMRQGDKVNISVIRLVTASIKNAEIAARRAEFDDPDILGVIAKQAKQCQESIEAFKKGNRPELVAKEEAELAILESYLPKQLTRQEVVAIVSRVIEEVGARGRGDMGKVMGRLMPQLKGKADGREVNAVVTELLNQ